MSNETRLSTYIPIVLYVDASWEMGGLGGYSVALAEGLIRRGYRVAAICHRADAIAALRQTLRQVGAEVHVVEDGDPTLTGRLRRVRGFVSVVRRYRGCVLALMMGYFTGGGIMTLAGVLGGARAVVRADLQPPVPPITWRHILGLRLKDAFTTRVVVGAVENRESFARKMGRSEWKIDVVNTGIDLAMFMAVAGVSEARKAFGFKSDSLVIGTVSRLSEDRKGITDFLCMAAQVASAFPNSAFVVVGDGLLRSRLQQEARDLGIGDRVTFAGWRADVPAIVSAMDVFVMPSLYEGGPTTVLEAMALARPTVATRVGMVPEVIDHGRTGLIVEPGNAHELGQAVSRLLADAPLRARMGAAAREEALRSFSIDVMVDRYVAVFTRAARPTVHSGDAKVRLTNSAGEQV